MNPNTAPDEFPSRNHSILTHYTVYRGESPNDFAALHREHQSIWSPATPEQAHLVLQCQVLPYQYFALSTLLIEVQTRYIRLSFQLDWRSTFGDQKPRFPWRL